MQVKIYKPTKNAMQSGLGKTDRWKLEFARNTAKFIDPLMGWVGQNNTIDQVNLFFDTVEEAVAYAEKHGLSYRVIEPKKRAIKPKSYAENFKYDRVKDQYNH